MAIINGLYLHVTGESVSRGVNATSHPVEDGGALTDTVRPTALALSIHGEIVDYDEVKTTDIISKLKEWQNSGSLISYSGLNVESDLQIRTFDTDHLNNISGGAKFSMELVKVRIAKSAYVPKSTTEQETAAKEELSPSDIAIGDIVVFKGGGVYYSSDAISATATRSRSTCEVTHISFKAESIHQFHLISTDGGRVYGWVDFENIAGAEEIDTSGTTNAGTQQLKKTSSGSSGKSSTGSTTETTTTTGTNPIYHKVKSGDTVYSIANKYSHLTPKPTTYSIMSNNSSAFEKAGAARTLKVGAYVLVGYK